MEGGVFLSHREQEEAEGADNKSWNMLGVQGSSSIAAVRESGAVGRGMASYGLDLRGQRRLKTKQQDLL